MDGTSFNPSVAPGTITPAEAPASIAAPNQPPTPPGDDAAYRAQAKAAAEKFEGFFISEMMKQMRRSAREIGGDDALFKDKLGGDMLEMADTMMADAMAGQHAFGIADLILRQLLGPLSAPAKPSP